MYIVIGTTTEQYVNSLGPGIYVLWHFRAFVFAIYER